MHAPEDEIEYYFRRGEVGTPEFFRGGSHGDERKHCNIGYLEKIRKKN